MTHEFLAKENEDKGIPGDELGVDKIDQRTDIFSFGAVTYGMLSGERPFTGATTNDVVAAMLGKDPEPLAKVAQQLTPMVAPQTYINS